MKSLFFDWATQSRRSDLLAYHVGAVAHHVSYGRQGTILQAPARYVVQAIRTWRILSRERPEVVFVQNPPIFNAVVAFLYTRRHGGRLVIDSHTAAFLSPKWRWSLALHRLLSRAAVVTIVTNNALKAVVDAWEAQSLVIGFTPGQYPAVEPYPLDAHFSVAVVSTFAADEPIDVVFEAASRLPDVTFYVTGDDQRLPHRLRATMPCNVRLTGCLPYKQYVGLLQGVDVVVDLTTRDHTLLMGAFEAISLGTPLITSDWPVLRQAFSKGVLHVPNTPEGLSEGLRRAKQERTVLRRDIALLHNELSRTWESKLAELKDMLAEPRPGNTRARIQRGDGVCES